MREPDTHANQLENRPLNEHAANAMGIDVSRLEETTVTLIIIVIVLISTPVCAVHCRGPFWFPVLLPP